MTRWYAAYTHPRKEDLATENLARQGFDVFFPRYLKRRSHARKVESVPAPLFPRYVFVAFDAIDGMWRAIRSTRGVIDLVRNGLDPVPVPDAIIQEIKRRQDDKGLVLLGRNLQLSDGDTFRIENGPLSSHLAIFKAMRDESRVIALLRILGREVTVQVPIAAVGPVY
jgi:transcriptional antiterminator RfaH